MIAGKLGGKRSPKDPDAVISPREKTLEYPSSIKIGYKIAPSAKIVTPEPPVNAVKNAHKSTTINTVDPGSQEACEAYRSGELYAGALTNNPNFVNLSDKGFSVLEGPSKVTGIN